MFFIGTEVNNMLYVFHTWLQKRKDFKMMYLAKIELVFANSQCILLLPRQLEDLTRLSLMEDWEELPSKRWALSFPTACNCCSTSWWLSWHFSGQGWVSWMIWQGRSDWFSGNLHTPYRGWGTYLVNREWSGCSCPVKGLHVTEYGRWVSYSFVWLDALLLVSCVMWRNKPFLLAGRRCYYATCSCDCLQW